MNVYSTIGTEMRQKVFARIDGQVSNLYLSNHIWKKTGSPTLHRTFRLVREALVDRVKEDINR